MHNTVHIIVFGFMTNLMYTIIYKYESLHWNDLKFPKNYYSEVQQQQMF